MRNFSLSTLARAVFLWSTLLLVFAPIAIVLTNTFKSTNDLNYPERILFTPTMANWDAVMQSGVFAAGGRSLIVGAVTVGISVIVGSMGAYAIARFKAGGSLSRFAVLAAQVLPPAVLVFPFLSMAFGLRINGTLIAVIFAHLSFILPVVTWFLIGFFASVPVSIEEQARVDGLNRFQAFRSVVLPQVYPGIGAAAIFGFTLSWNDLFYALILAPGNAQTIPVAIAGFNTFRGVELGLMSAAIVISIVPVFIASFFIQRRLVQGISGGAVKF